jgi:hypothetical protein
MRQKPEIRIISSIPALFLVPTALRCLAVSGQASDWTLVRPAGKYCGLTPEAFQKVVF